jgi:hypothetical protein
MWTTLALLSVLGATPAQSGLSLTHVRLTHGLLGPQRQDETVAPGDVLFVCFDIKGIRVDAEGKVRYRLGIEASDASGRMLFQRVAEEQAARASLGGDSVPAYAQLTVGLDTPPGEYQLKVLVRDVATQGEQSLTRKVKVLPKSFALVRTSVTLDVDASYPAAVFACGQGVWVHTSAVGFDRGGDKNANVVFEMRVLDDSGKPTLAQPMTGTPPKDLPNNLSGLPMGFPLTLNRPGKFTVELEATDRISGKKAKTSIPLVVQGAEAK